LGGATFFLSDDEHVRSTSSILATAVGFGEEGACSSIFESKYFFGGVETVSNLLPLRGGIIGGLADRGDAAGRVDVVGAITGLVDDCLLVVVVAVAVEPLDFWVSLLGSVAAGISGLFTRLMVDPVGFSEELKLECLGLLELLFVVSDLMITALVVESLSATTPRPLVTPSLTPVGEASLASDDLLPLTASPASLLAPVEDGLDATPTPTPEERVVVMSIIGEGLAESQSRLIGLITHT
jgi:hypothetical protein